MKTLFISILAVIFLAGCNSQVDNPAPPAEPTYTDTLAMLDTAYVDPISGKIKPPCSLSPAYCDCLVHRGAARDRIPDCH
ncbi:MAG: hypothetical protein PHO56_00080 [Patescibacteria group bacterium]|nr:hypothetical protein [Patescibacteria group bacterium]